MGVACEIYQQIVAKLFGENSLTLKNSSFTSGYTLNSLKL